VSGSQNTEHFLPAQGHLDQGRQTFILAESMSTEFLLEEALAQQELAAEGLATGDVAVHLNLGAEDARKHMSDGNASPLTKITHPGPALGHKLAALCSRLDGLVKLRIVLCKSPKPETLLAPAEFDGGMLTDL
jgi:hypothetical protein